MRPKRLGPLLVLALIVTLVLVTSVDAHRSGCHRWHSCPSDRGTYVCGDLGHCSQCPDNDYCVLGKPRADKQTPQDPKQAEPRQQRPRPRGNMDEQKEGGNDR